MLSFTRQLIAGYSKNDICQIFDFSFVVSNVQNGHPRPFYRLHQQFVNFIMGLLVECAQWFI